MRRFFRLLSLPALALAIGCAGVVSTHPVGESPVVLLAEEWEGTWSDSEDFLELRVVDSDAGHLEAAWIESKDDGFELERVEVWVRQSDDALFGNALDSSGDDEVSEEGVDGRFAVFRLGREADQLVIWWPRVEAFRDLVEAGALAGAVTDDDNVVLGQLSAEELALLSSDESAGLWEWQKPEVLVRRGD